RVGAAEADVGLTAVLQVLHLDLHVGAALAGLGVLDLGDLPDAAFVFEDVAGTDVHAADFHGSRSLRWEGETDHARNRAPRLSRAARRGQARWHRLAGTGRAGLVRRRHDTPFRDPRRRRPLLARRFG